MLQEVINRFKKLSDYNPSKGIINEAFGDVDTSNYICIGEVPYYCWGNSDKKKSYIMVSPEKTMKGGDMVYDIRYTENSDGTGAQTNSIPTYARNQATIYNEYRDTEYGELFLGKKKDEEVVKQKHKEFMSKLFKLGYMVIIHHNSSYKITDGIIKKGAPNNWSNNTDIGIYFWGSRNSGRDPSGNSLYTYYCYINLDDLYDLEANKERLTLQKAMSQYPYVGQYWGKNDEAIVVSTYKLTPIWCILDKQTGKWYDKDWNEIKKPF